MDISGELENARYQITSILKELDKAETEHFMSLFYIQEKMRIVESVCREINNKLYTDVEVDEMDEVTDDGQ